MCWVRVSSTQLTISSEYAPYGFGRDFFFDQLKLKLEIYTMDEEKVMAEVMNLLEAEPAPSALLPAADIPALREDLAILQMQRSNRREPHT